MGKYPHLLCLKYFEDIVSYIDNLLLSIHIYKSISTMSDIEVVVNDIIC